MEYLWTWQHSSLPLFLLSSSFQPSGWYIRLWRVCGFGNTLEYHHLLLLRASKRLVDLLFRPVPCRWCVFRGVAWPRWRLFLQSPCLLMPMVLECLQLHCVRSPDVPTSCTILRVCQGTRLHCLRALRYWVEEAESNGQEAGWREICCCCFILHACLMRV